MLKISFAVTILFFAFPVFAQHTFSLTGDYEKDNYSSVLEFQKNYLYRIYYQKIGSKDEMINGKEYVNYYNRSKLKPILFPDRKHTASISLNDRTYNNVSLEYDTYLDDIIFFDKSRVINNRLYQIAFNKDLVLSFAFYTDQDSMIFKNFKSGEGSNFNLKSGFYEVVYEGRSKYIIKHQSYVFEKEGVDQYYYTPANYVMVRDNYIRIRSSGGFIKLFGEKSDEIRKFMRTNRVDIRKTDKIQIAKVLRYYDNLIKAER